MEVPNHGTSSCHPCGFLRSQWPGHAGGARLLVRRRSGVVETGPANLHFIRDIGLGFVAAAAALFLAVRNASAALLVPASLFLGGHAGLHLVEMLVHGTTLAAAVRDTALILVPGLLPLYALWRSRALLSERTA